MGLRAPTAGSRAGTGPMRDRPRRRRSDLCDALFSRASPRTPDGDGPGVVAGNELLESLGTASTLLVDGVVDLLMQQVVIALHVARRGRCRSRSCEATWDRPRRERANATSGLAACAS